METTLKFDRVVLIKELNDKFSKIGEVFEVANILENSFLLRDAKTKVAIGVVSFDDFEKHFVHKPNYNNKWTQWTLFTGFDGQNDCMYRTNGRKVQCKFITSKVRAESCCCKDDEFNLSFGIKLAYLRARNKMLIQKKIENGRVLQTINTELSDNKNIIKKMINSLNAS